MIKALTIGLLALIYFGKGGSFKCLHCQNVARNNVCTHKENTCDSGLWKFCYTRLISKNSVMTHVERGCSLVCRNLKRGDIDYEERMLCCVRNFCNSHNFWTNE